MDNVVLFKISSFFKFTFGLYFSIAIKLFHFNNSIKLVPYSPDVIPSLSSLTLPSYPYPLYFLDRNCLNH